MTRKELKNRTILEKALALFAEKDFHSVQMDDIATAANVSKGTLYNHFRSKEDLYLSTIRTRLEKLGGILSDTYDTRQNDPWRNLRSFVIHYEGFMRKNSHFFRILRKCDSIFNDKANNNLAQIRNQPRAILEQLIRSGINIGSFRKTDPVAAADMIIGMIEARLLSRLVGEKGNREPKEILDFLSFGLAKSNGGKAK